MKVLDARYVPIDKLMPCPVLARVRAMRPVDILAILPDGKVAIIDARLIPEEREG